jgi:hypothetical protein
MKNPRLLIAVALLLAVASPMLAQTAPATAPATTQPPPHKVTLPAGFKLLTVNGRKAIVESADEAWVTTALGKMPATTKPATQPAAMLDKLRAERENIIRAMMADLATNDPVPLAKDYDTVLTPQLKALDGLRPPVYYLVTAPERLSAIMQAGWEDPRFYYNRAANTVSFNPAGALSSDREMDDLVFPVMYNPKETPEKHGEALTVQITGTEASITASIDLRARMMVGTGFAQLVNNTTFEPLKLKEDQVWLSIGVSTILAAKYTAIVTNQPRLALVQQLIYEHPQHPLKMSAINLLQPADMKNMRPEAVPAYLDTVRRKSARAIQYLVEQGGGDGAIAKAVSILRDKKPADGAALVKEIQDATKVDLTPALAR